ncbi:competence protein CoiA [Vagococcus zengguangii]|uniref:Competence protein CoiA n=1 Tax=Vagococcus zengguangii TaxID=2571750 RepID=A0A4D7CXH3_9ENTE|nr:competence protein CoiA family protein [Vagococcus zengguangii]QCI87151.1 hypothetical protein FA707_09510 [Vagococcus zengguangii]TLG80656.1 hypothetical protein FE258_04125 [Vagococcus zengguangii]
MMLVAETGEGQIINIMEETRTDLERKRTQELFCPTCHQAVIMKLGMIKQPHFAHKHRHKCQGLSEPETMEHLVGKALIYQWAKQAEIGVQLEYALMTIEQRPDVWLDQHVAIEFQCSPLALERLAERNQGYNSQQAKVCWVLGQKFRLNERLTSLQRAFLEWHPKLGNYLLFLDVTSEQVVLTYHIQELAFTHELSYSELILTQSEFLQFIMTGIFSRNIYHQWQYLLGETYQKQFQYLQRALYSRQKEVMRIQRALYVEGYHLLALHPIILLPNILEKTSFLNAIKQRIKLLELLHQQKSCQKEEVFSAEENHINRSQFDEWLELLADLSLIEIHEREIKSEQPPRIMLTEEEIQQFIEKFLNNRVFVSRLPHNVVS